MKPKYYIKRCNIDNMIIVKARRTGMTYSWYKLYRILYTYLGVPKYLPRKLKKKWIKKHRKK